MKDAHYVSQMRQQNLEHLMVRCDGAVHAVQQVTSSTHWEDLTPNQALARFRQPEVAEDADAAIQISELLQTMLVRSQATRR